MERGYVWIYHNDIIRVSTLGLNENILRDPLFYDLRLLEVGLESLPSFQALFDSMTISLVDEATWHILIRVGCAERPGGGIRRDVVVDDYLYQVSRRSGA